MAGTGTLEAHIVAELDKWSRGRMPYEDWDYRRYESPFIEFGPRSEISCGRMELLEIHVGNLTEAYVEELRFKPSKMMILAVPNLDKERWGKGHCNYVDFFTYVLYQHPEGTWYSSHEVAAYDGDRRKAPVRVPFDYEVRDLLPVSKANKLLNRNPAVLQELDERIAALVEMRKKLTGDE